MTLSSKFRKEIYPTPLATGGGGDKFGKNLGY
jgi:hypothetical protein